MYVNTIIYHISCLHWGNYRWKWTYIYLVSMKTTTYGLYNMGIWAYDQAFSYQAYAAIKLIYLRSLILKSLNFQFYFNQRIAIKRTLINNKIGLRSDIIKLSWLWLVSCDRTRVLGGEFIMMRPDNFESSSSLYSILTVITRRRHHAKCDKNYVTFMLQRF